MIEILQSIARKSSSRRKSSLDSDLHLSSGFGFAHTQAFQDQTSKHQTHSTRHKWWVMMTSSEEEYVLGSRIRWVLQSRCRQLPNRVLSPNTDSYLAQPSRVLLTRSAESLNNDYDRYNLKMILLFRFRCCFVPAMMTSRRSMQHAIFSSHRLIATEATRHKLSKTDRSRDRQIANLTSDRNASTIGGSLSATMGFASVASGCSSRKCSSVVHFKLFMFTSCEVNWTSTSVVRR